MLRYLRRNPSLAVGIALLAVLVVFIVVGMTLIDPEDARPLSAPALRPPSWEYPFGTDRQGRDLFAAMVVGTPLTLRIGFIAGILGVTIGTVLAFVAGFYRGMVDTVIRGIADIGLTVPGLLILIIIAVSVRGGLTVNQMALVVASLAWLNPTRTIRSQVLTLRERGYVEVARLSGMSGPEIIFFEMIPNLLPYLGATLGQRGVGRHSGVDRAGSARAWAIGIADPRHDAVLGELQRRDHQRLVVVVDGTDRDHPAGVPRAVLHDRRAGRNRQSQAAAFGMSALRIEGLRVSFDHPLGVVRAVDDVSFALMPNERFGLVGEFGLGQVHHGAGDHAHDPTARPHRRRQRSARTARTFRRCRTMRSGGPGWRASPWCRKDR